MLDAAGADRGDGRAATSSSTSPPTPTCASAPSIRARISSRTPSPPSTCSRRCAPTASRRIAFSSTGSIYGEPTVFPTPENAPFPVQTSLYGASKLAGEGLIQAYCEGFGFQGCIFRFVSILGERYTHGHVFDFYQQPARRSDASCACSATASSASRISTSRTASTRSCIAIEQAHGQGQHLQPRHRRVLRGQRLDRLDLPGTSALDARRWTTPAASAAGSATARSSFSTRAQDPRARLDAEADDPRGHHPDARLSAGQSLAARGARMKVCVLGLWHLGTVTAACLARPGTTSSASISIRAVIDGLVTRQAAALRARPRRSACSTVSRAAACGSPPIAATPSPAPTSSGSPIDTPVDDDDRADVESRRAQASRAASRHLRDGALVLDLVAAAGRHRRGGSSRMFAARRRRPHGRLRLFAGEPAARQGDRGVHAARPRRRRRARPTRDRAIVAALLRAVHRPHRVDVGRVGRDDQARAQRVPGDVGRRSSTRSPRSASRSAPTRRRSSAG